jgi:hypothetical protein
MNWIGQLKRHLAKGYAMSSDTDRRSFLKSAVLASTTAALALQGAQMTLAQAPPPAPQNALPFGKIGDLRIGRILLGGNLLTHYTHSRDLQYVYNLTKAYNTEEKIFDTMALAESHGVNALVIHTAPNVLGMMKKYRDQRKGKMQWIICSTANIENPTEYAKALQQMVDAGADAAYIWGVQTDGLAASGKVGVIAKAVETAKSLGVPCGVGAHELIVMQECEKAKVPADFYIKTLHHHNYPSAKLNHDSMWCKNPEETIAFMKTVQKPWISFKVMAAGAIAPEDAFRYVFSNGADFSLAGMFDFEIAEDVAIAKRVLAGLPQRSRPWRA